MFKAMILLKRNADMSFREFTDWWLAEHAPLAKELPGLQKGVFNLVEGQGDEEFDGVSELWFDTKEAFEAAYATETGKAVANDSLSKVSKRVRLFVAENSIK
ncbi:EthD family reductase [Alphaproteobacteria bacterium]|jgi:uncharacterized protein (TIGR02118 family)|nr:EthD family reductase [Alphaproteobacteria bacterium]